ncbi:unnamed protein product, partial [Brassica oleracea]
PIISFVSYFSFWTFDFSVVAFLWDHLIFSTLALSGSVEFLYFPIYFSTNTVR